MKIITRLKWAQWLCVAGVALAVLLMIGATRQVKQELQRNERAGEIVSGVVALRYLSLEYAQTQERRSHIQWQLRKDSLQGLLLRDELFREAEEAQLLHDLQENLPLLARHFSELLLVRQELRATPERAEVLHLLEARLFGQLMSRTQDMIRDAEELARRSRQGVLQAQQNASAVAAGLGLLLLRLALDEFADHGHALALTVVLLDLVGRADGFVLRHRLAHLGQREVFELADAFAGDVELASDFLEREFVAAFETEAELDDFGFAGVEWCRARRPSRCTPTAIAVPVALRANGRCGPRFGSCADVASTFRQPRLGRADPARDRQ